MKKRIEAILKDEGINIEDFYSVCFSPLYTALQGDYTKEKAEKYGVAFERVIDGQDLDVYRSIYGEYEVVLTKPINHEQE